MLSALSRLLKDKLKLLLSGLLLLLVLVVLFPPCFCDNLMSAQREKAWQDLQLLDSAIQLRDAREESPLGSEGLVELLGPYLQELPKDPWGNPYHYDAELGMLACFGADGVVGGTGADEDILVTRRPGDGTGWGLEVIAKRRALEHARRGAPGAPGHRHWYAH